MAQTIDARGLSCPQPVVLTKNALDKAPSSCEVLVDNPTARENVTRYAERAGYRVSVSAEGEDFRLTLATISRPFSPTMTRSGSQTTCADGEPRYGFPPCRGA